MEELEFLKKNWNKNNFPEVSEKDIYGMLHKNSSTTVKCIFYVSILEFVILNGIGFILSDSKYDEFLKNHIIFNYLEYLNYAVILLYIYIFYKNYKEISVLNNAKRLMQIILRTRKTVTYYIYWNIIIGSISGAYGGLLGFQDGYNAAPGKDVKIDVNWFTLGCVSIFIILILWGFYKLLYGRFLNKLKQNYSELIKIDL